MAHLGRFLCFAIMLNCLSKAKTRTKKRATSSHHQITITHSHKIPTSPPLSPSGKLQPGLRPSHRYDMVRMLGLNKRSTYKRNISVEATKDINSPSCVANAHVDKKGRKLGLPASLFRPLEGEHPVTFFHLPKSPSHPLFFPCFCLFLTTVRFRLFALSLSLSFLILVGV